ncbi:MAG: hypothetical protein ACI93R_003881 [Flavobacteriales bacterium]|jgi:hypothetical protein
MIISPTLDKILRIDKDTLLPQNSSEPDKADLMTLTTKKAPKGKAAKSTKKLTTKQRLHNEWKKIIKLQKRNESLREELIAFTKDVSLQIKSDEQNIADAMYAQTEHLTEFLTRKTLAEWQKAELFEWIKDNIMQLSSTPFANAADVQKLTEKANAIIVKLFGDQHSDDLDPAHQDNENTAGKSKQNKRKKSPNQDMFEDLFSEFDSDDSDDTTYEDDEESYWENLYEEHFKQRENVDQQQLEKNKALNSVLKKSSINIIFRRLARVLHPDREQDETLKAERHEQMSELISARDNNDVFKLLSMYETHTGESPLGSIEENEDDVLKLLKAQVSQLQNEHQHIIYEDPLQAHYYELFYAKTDKVKERKIKKYCTELREMTNNERHITKSIRSIATLKPYLKERYEMSGFFGEFDASGMPY